MAKDTADQGQSSNRKKFRARSSGNYSIKNTSGSNEFGAADGDAFISETSPEPNEYKKLTKAELKSITFSNFDFDRPNPSHEPVRLSQATTHSNLSMTYDLERLCVSNPNKGYRSCKATHGVERGCWYYEVEVPIDATGHFRVGWSQILGDLNAPVGYDEYSYSFRDVDGGAFHVSRGKPYGQKWGPGDVIGCMVEISAFKESMRTEANRLLGQIQAKYPPKKEGTYKVSLEILPTSRITFFVNGISQGVAFTNLYNAKYYPALSIYMGGPLKVNFGPNFAFPPSQSHKPVSRLHEVALADGTEN